MKMKFWILYGATLGMLGCQGPMPFDVPTNSVGTQSSALNSSPVYKDPSADQNIAGPYKLTFPIGVVGNLNNVRTLDGLVYPFTSAGLLQAVSDCIADTSCPGVDARS